jgi:FkbM family methyltransferase
MFRLWSNFISSPDFLTSLVGSQHTGWGDLSITERPLSVFVDIIPEPRQLEYNEYNILYLYQPDDVSKLKAWALENGHKFSCIITSDSELLEAYDTAFYFERLPFDEMISQLKDFLHQIIEGNGITESKYWSQEMEDRWIDENLVLPDKGFFLDVGACYPKILSNTYFFEKSKGWDGLAIEPDPVYFSWLKPVRKCHLENVAISPTVGSVWFMPKTKVLDKKNEDSIEVPCARLDNLLNKYSVTNIDLISIDIEGYEKVAWSTFDYKKYNPKVIIVEHTEGGEFKRGFADDILQNTDYYIAHATPLNFILVHKNVERK